MKVIKLQLALQKATSHLNNLPTRQQFTQWINTVLQITPSLFNNPKKIEITIRLVDEQESAQLNEQYRHKSGPTNILSFPTENLSNAISHYLGDLLICVPLVFKEATEQNKMLVAHWAHLTIHGVLHLLGYDHENENDAIVMEELEINILKELEYKNPYVE